jgi:hypothetical protein
MRFALGLLVWVWMPGINMAKRRLLGVRVIWGDNGP